MPTYVEKDRNRITDPSFKTRPDPLKKKESGNSFFDQKGEVQNQINFDEQMLEESYTADDEEGEYEKEE